MPSVNDVYNQLVTVNSTLSAIAADVNAGTAATNAVKASVDNLDNDLNSGFNQTIARLNAAVTALDVIAAIELESAKILFHLTQQADTMICTLEHVSQNTCAMLTQSTIQTALQTEIRNDADGLLAIAQTAYPAAALESSRLAALQAEIWKCCPPETPPPACSYEPCPKPDTLPPPKLPQPPRDDGGSPVKGPR